MGRTAQRVERFCPQLDLTLKTDTGSDHLIERFPLRCYNRACSTRSQCPDCPGWGNLRSSCARRAAFRTRVQKRGQVAQVVERSPEKAGVGGSTPSLATTFQRTYSESLDVSQPTVCPQNEGLR